MVISEKAEDKAFPKDTPSSRGRQLFFGIVLSIVLASIVCVGVYAAFYLHRFLNSSRMSAEEFIQTIQHGYKNRSTIGTVNLLLLGLDNRDDEFEHTLLTDAMIFASFNTKKAKMTLVPLPRDLWLPEFATKINALYYYGTLAPNTKPLKYVADQVGTIVGQRIVHTIAINYEALPKLIDLLGGIDVTVSRSFTDEEYPNPAYIEASNTRETPYMTISFTKGRQHINGQQALELIRSRHSKDPEEGSDIARSRRQMEVFRSLIAKLSSAQTIADPVLLGNVYRYWKGNFIGDMQDSDIASIFFAMIPRRRVSIASATIPLEGDSQAPVLVHPPDSKYGQWVWEAVGDDWSKLHEFIAESIRGK